jgi:tRNA isopentenyl-2-thiomethyl-A-37 hydroxylase MiaE
MKEKKFFRCNIVKSVNEFCKNKSTKDGLHCECKTCKTELYLINKDKYFPKVECEWEKSIYKYYLLKRLLLRIHFSRIEMIMKRRDNC